MEKYNVEYIDLSMVTPQQIDLEDDDIQDHSNIMRISFDKEEQLQQTSVSKP